MDSHLYCSSILSLSPFVCCFFLNLYLWFCTFNPSWTTPACTSAHCWTTPASKNTLRKWVSYTMSHNSSISLQISSKFCVYVDYIIGYYIFLRELCCYGNKTSCHLWKGDFDCINLSVSFRCWSCSDVQHNQKNLVAVLKKLILEL